jgi:hypothetical protein
MIMNKKTDNTDYQFFYCVGIQGFILYLVNALLSEMY